MALITVPVLQTSVGVPSGSTCWTTQTRATSTTNTVDVDTPEPPPSIFTRFWKWFNCEIEEEVSFVSLLQLLCVWFLVYPA